MTTADGTPSDRRSDTIISASLVVLHALALSYLAVFRYVDRDEGFYLSAASSVAHGHTPYADFFFPQMPFLPYVLALVSGHGFSTLLYSRLIGLIPATLTPIVLVLILRKVTEVRATRLFVLFLYCLCGLVMVWHAVAKTYAWTDLFLTVLFLGLLRAASSRKLWWWTVAGASFALALNFRSVLVIVALPIAFALESGPKEGRWKIALSILLPAIVISLPTILLLVNDPARFYFNNLGFHFVRNPGVDLGASLVERVGAIAKFLLNPQIWVVIVGLIVAWKARTSARMAGIAGVNPFVLAALFGGVVAFVYLLPSPVHVQYFEQMIPFALIAAVPGFDSFFESPRGTLFGLTRRKVVKAFGVLYVLALLPFVVIYLGAIREDDKPYSIKNMRSLTEFVQSYPDHGPVLSEWAGVPVLADRPGLPGYEYIGFQYPLPLTWDKMRAYHLPVNGDLDSLLREEDPALYVVWNQPDSAVTAVARRNYHVAKEFDKFKVLVRNDVRP